MKRIPVFQRIAAFVILIAGLTGALWAQSVESLMNDGQDLLQRGAYSQAVTAFKKVLAQDPTIFEAQFNLGFAYLQWGNNAQAITELKKAQKMQPKNSEIWANLAIAYENMNRSDDAISALAQAVNCNPENVTARMNLAAMYVNANKTQQAIVQYREVAKLEPTNGEVVMNLAKCLALAGNIAEAKEFLQKALSFQPNKGEPHSELGNIYWKKENAIDKAIAEYRLAIAVEPNNPAFYHDLASALESKGLKQEAIDTWKKSLIYLDDAMSKEKVQDRIDRLEKALVTTPGFTGGQAGSTLSKEKTRDLERELRPETPREEPRRIDAKPVDVGSDLDQVSSDSSAWDLTKEAKKRAQSRKPAEEK